MRRLNLRLGDAADAEKAHGSPARPQGYVQAPEQATRSKAAGWETDLVYRAQQMSLDELSLAIVQSQTRFFIFGHRRMHALLLHVWIARGMAPRAAYVR